MADLLFVLITVAFFAIAVGFVQLCDKVIGPDAEHGELTSTGEAAPAATAPPATAPPASHPEPATEAMTTTGTGR